MREQDAGDGPAGRDQIDAGVAGVLGPAWMTAREISAQTMLAPESVARSLYRLVEAGMAEANTERPRGYRLPRA